MRGIKITPISNALKDLCQGYEQIFTSINKTGNTLRKIKIRRHLVPIRAVMCLFLLLMSVSSIAQSTNSNLKEIINQVKKEQKKAPDQINLKKVINGTVRDEDGLTSPGVTVLLKGTLVGTVTDNDGNYDFPQKLDVGDTLEFRFLGHNPVEYVIKNKTKKANVNLSRTVLLQSHIVVFGALGNSQVYGRKKNNNR